MPSHISDILRTSAKPANLSYLEIDNNGLVPLGVDAVENPLAAHDDDLPANVELVLQHVTNLQRQKKKKDTDCKNFSQASHLSLQASWTLVHPGRVNLDPVESQVVLPRTVDVIQAILHTKCRLTDFPTDENCIIRTCMSS